MTMTARLEVRDVTAHIRGNEYDRPIQVGYDGTRIVLLLDSKPAEQLARILAQVAVDPNPEQATAALTVDKDQQDTWLHAMIEILTSKALMNGVAIDVAYPNLRAVQ